MKRVLTALIFLYFTGNLPAQNADSLEQALKASTVPAERVDLLIKTAFELIFSSPDKCDQYLIEAIQLSKQHNLKSELPKAYRLRGVLYMEGYDLYALSGLYLDSAMAGFTELKDTFGIAKTFNNKGALNYYQSNRTAATDYYKKALKLLLAIHNEEEAAKVLFNVGNMKMESGDYVSAREYFSNYLRYAEKSGNLNSQSIAHINIGHTWFETGKYDTALPEFMKAIKLAEEAGNAYYQVQALTFAANIFKTMDFKDKAVSFYQQAHDIAFKAKNRSIQANTLMSLANLYIENSMKDSALFLVDRAYKIYEEASDDRGMAATFRFRGDYLKAEKKPALALAQYFKAMSYSSAMEYEIFKGNLMHLIGFCYADLYRMPESAAPDSLKSRSLLMSRATYYLESALSLSQPNDQRVLQKNIHEELASIYAEQGNFKKAYSHYREFIVLRDSIFSEESILKIAKLEARHDVEIRQRELAFQKIKLVAAQKDKWVIAGGSVLLFIGAGIYVYRYRRQQKTKRRRELENVRMRISRDLHDEVGSTLSAMQFLSHSAKKRMSENEHEKAASSIEKMRENAVEVQETMSDIVWNIKPESDRLESMLHRMREYAGTSFDSKGIVYTFTSDCDNELLLLEPGLKNNIYRIFKEAVNNCIKHSGCTNADIQLSVKNNSFFFELRDNGKGIPESAKEGSGNGLRNMRQRAGECGAVLKIDSSSRGTIISMSCKITSSGDWLN